MVLISQAPTVSNNNLLEIIKLILPILISIAGWWYGYHSLKEQTITTNKSKAYEALTKSYIKLMGLTFENKIEDFDYYDVIKEVASISVWAPQNIVDQSNVVEKGILNHQKTHDRKASQLKINEDLLNLVNMMRYDVNKNSPVKNLFEVNTEE